MRTKVHDTLIRLFVWSETDMSTMDSRLRGNDGTSGTLDDSSFPRWRESTTSSPPHGHECGFTMIELTTVGIMITILICIALPNFLEAQIRARTVAAQSDAHLLSQCLEEYYIANRVYPPNRVEKIPDGGLAGDGNPDLRGSALTALTTPVVYLSLLPWDMCFYGDAPRKIYDYINFVDWMGKPISRETLGGRGSAAYMVVSIGPDGLPNTFCAKQPATSNPYAPTNGTKSLGDIFVFGP